MCNDPDNLPRQDTPTEVQLYQLKEEIVKELKMEARKAGNIAGAIIAALSLAVAAFSVAMTVETFAIKKIYSLQNRMEQLTNGTAEFRKIVVTGAEQGPHTIIEPSRIEIVNGGVYARLRVVGPHTSATDERYSELQLQYDNDSQATVLQSPVFDGSAQKEFGRLWFKDGTPGKSVDLGTSRIANIPKSPEA